MEEKEGSSSNDVPILDMKYYFSWRRKINACLNKFGVWEIVINPPAPSNKKGKSAAWKEAKKENTKTLNFLMGGLPSSVNESVRDYISTKDLWLKLESKYEKKIPYMKR